LKKLKFGRVQLRIMKVLWKKQRVSAREITDALNENDKIAHSTVQTLLRGLEHKGAIDHDIDYRTFIYYPLVKSEQVIKHSLSDMIDIFFAGSTSSLVSFLTKKQYISPGELKEVSEKLAQEE
jgi:BlaI family transcriptional regulator, penicillinase repressor